MTFRVRSTVDCHQLVVRLPFGRRSDLFEQSLTITIQLQYSLYPFVTLLVRLHDLSVRDDQVFLHLRSDACALRRFTPYPLQHLNHHHLPPFTISLRPLTASSPPPLIPSLFLMFDKSFHAGAYEGEDLYLHQGVVDESRKHC